MGKIIWEDNIGKFKENDFTILQMEIDMEVSGNKICMISV